MGSVKSLFLIPSALVFCVVCSAQQTDQAPVPPVPPIAPSESEEQPDVRAAESEQPTPVGTKAEQPAEQVPTPAEPKEEPVPQVSPDPSQNAEGETKNGLNAETPTGEKSSAEKKQENPVNVTAAYRGIVKIEVAKRLPDYKIPWQAGQFGRGSGTGFMVAPGVFMTNAHVVADAERIYVSPYADARKIPAKVKYVAHDADLALVEVEDSSAFADVPYLEFSKSMPHLEDEVRAIGYPIGGNRLSVTRGIISRIDTIPYAHPQNDSHLIVQIDAAINPGNSGGPVLMGDKVVGVAFQGLMQANSTGYMIPLPVINRFLQDVKDGRYDRYVEIGAEFFPMENPAMRKHFGLPDDAMGALVGEVVRGSSCDGKLKIGDVVLAVDGHPVDSSGMIELDGERVKLEELAERAFNGDSITFSILRAGTPAEVNVTLQPLPAAAGITGNAYDELPRYVQFAGMIFQPLQRNVIAAHDLNPVNFIVEMEDFLQRGGWREKEDIVVLTTVLADELNARFDDYGSRVVTKVNGHPVKGLSHLYSLLYPAAGEERPEFTVIEFKDAPRPFVVENAALQAGHARISAGYNIPQPSRL